VTAHDEKRALLEEISKRVHQFDAVALRLLLRKLGYDSNVIAYCGHFSQASQPYLFSSIDILEDDGAPRQQTIADSYREPGAWGDAARLRIKGNVGLLSSRSPLPTYFLKLLDDQDYQGPLVTLFDMLDDTLIDDRLASFRPEWERATMPDWDDARFDLLRLTSLATSCSLHSVFQRVFPELGVAVRFAPASRSVEVPEVLLGTSVVGEAAFGGEAEVPVDGFSITLVCREPLSREDVPWLREIESRLRERVFPRLGGTNVHVTVTALLFEPLLDAELDEQSRLGHHPLPGGKKGLRRVVVFAGPVRSSAARPHDHPDLGERAGAPQFIAGED